MIRDAFTRAQDYQREWADYKAKVAKGEKNLVSPRRDLELEPRPQVRAETEADHRQEAARDAAVEIIERPRGPGARLAQQGGALGAVHYRSP